MWETPPFWLTVGKSPYKIRRALLAVRYNQEMNRKLDVKQEDKGENGMIKQDATFMAVIQLLF